MPKTLPPAQAVEFLMGVLAGPDAMARVQARKSLSDLGTPVVFALSEALRYSSSSQLRWEAAKTLALLMDPASIPALLKALEDGYPDVSWVAAEALGKFKRTAWPPLLDLLTKDWADSFLLRQRAQHVFRGQVEEGYNDLLVKLRASLVSPESREAASAAAHEILERMKTPPTQPSSNGVPAPSNP